MKQRQRRVQSEFPHAGSMWRCDGILMTLHVSWRPPFGRLMFYQLLMKLCVLSPSSLRSHNASVMFCQVRHDERGDDGVKLLEGRRRIVFHHRLFFSSFLKFSARLKQKKPKLSPDTSFLPDLFPKSSFSALSFKLGDKKIKWTNNYRMYEKKGFQWDYFGLRSAAFHFVHHVESEIQDIV